MPLHDPSTPATSPPSRAWVPGVVAAVVYAVATVLAVLLHTTPDALLVWTASERSVVSMVPALALAVVLLVVGLLDRRWALAPVAAVLVPLVAWGQATWVRDIPQWLADQGLTFEEGKGRVELVSGLWSGAVVLAVAVGWSLVRRRGWTWALGLVPALVVCAIAFVVARAIEGPVDTPTGVVAGDVEAAMEAIASELRTQTLMIAAVWLLATLAAVWVCRLLEDLPSTRTPGGVRAGDAAEQPGR